LAEKTPDSAKPEVVFDTAKSGQVVRRFPYVSENVDNGDTWTLTSSIPNATRVAWEPVNTTDAVAATLSSGVVTFSAGSDNHNGYLIVWSGS
jgi:hypothetical protein